MGSTNYERMVANHVNGQLRRDHGLGAMLVEELGLAASGEIPPQFRDAIVQRSRGHLDLCDAFVILKIRAMIAASQLALVPIRVSCPPGRDADEEHNNRILGALSHPFRARFIGKGGDGPDDGDWGDDDGHLEWTEPVVAVTGDDERAVIEPGSVPLEVGTTKSSRTMLHVIEDRGVARWPYGHRDITILVAFKGPDRHGFPHVKAVI